MKQTRSLLVLGFAVWGVAQSFPTAALAQWIGASEGQWGTGSNWTGGVAPNAIDASAIVNTALTVNISNVGGTYPYTFGSFSSTLAANASVVIGNNTVTTDQLTAAVSSGSPTINVANANTNVFWYATLGGTQGFTKSGAGRLTFRFNAATQAYSGNVLISGGVLGITNNGSLGNDDNDISIANGARLLLEPSPSATVTLPATRTFTLTGLQSQIGAGGTADHLIINGNIGQSAAGQGLVKTDLGKVTLNGTISYTGETRIAGGTLALTGSAFLPAGQNLRFTQTAAGTLDIGSKSQTVRTIVMDNTAGNRTITGVGGSLTVNGDATLQLTGGNATSISFAGLDNFTFNRSNRPMNVQVENAPSVTAAMDMDLAKLNNTITSSLLLVGGSPTSPSTGNDGSIARLHLGTTNTINTDAFQIGAFNAAGSVDVQTGISSATLKLRGANGTAALPSMTVGFTSSGTRSGQGRLDLTRATLDAQVTDLVVSRHNAGATTLHDISSITLPAGNLEAATILLAWKSSSGATPTADSPIVQGTINQLGGTVRTSALTFGRNDISISLPRLRPVYNLNGGTLAAETISVGTGPFSTVAGDTFRNLNINGGTLRNYDANTDLVVSGLDFTSGGRLNIIVGNSGATIHADPERTVTIGQNVPVTRSGTGSLTKSGTGTLRLEGTTANLPVIVSEGRLTLASAAAITGNVSVSGSAVLSGNGTINGLATIDGTLSPGESAGLLTITSLSLGSTAVSRFELEANADQPAARGASGGYDAVDVTTSLAYDGTLEVDFAGNTFDNGSSFELFGGTASRGGDFAAVALSGTGYGGLGNLSPSGGIWSAIFGGTIFQFSTSTGILSLSAAPVPEPLTAAGILLLSSRVLARRTRASL